MLSVYRHLCKPHHTNKRIQKTEICIKNEKYDKHFVLTANDILTYEHKPCTNGISKNKNKVIAKKGMIEIQEMRNKRS